MEYDFFNQPEKDLDQWFDSLFDSIAEQVQEVLDSASEGDTDEMLLAPLPSVKLLRYENNWHIILCRDGEKYLFVCKCGDEATLIRELMSQADDSSIAFGWLDAAAICRKIGEYKNDDVLSIELDDDTWDLFGDQAA